MSHNNTLIFKSNRGASLIEVSVALGVSAIIAIGVGHTLIQNVQVAKDAERHSEASAAANELRGWMARVKKNPVSCAADSTLPGYTTAAAFSALAASGAGAPIQIDVGGGRLVGDNQTLAGTPPILVRGLRLTDSTMVYTDTATNTNYYTGKLVLNAGQVINANQGTAREFSPQVIGGLTIAVNNVAGTLASCTALANVGGSGICTAINGVTTGGPGCERATTPYEGVNCPAGTTFAGFIHSTGQVLCVVGDIFCGNN